MADRSVTRDDSDDNARWIPEPRWFRHWRRIQAVWRAFVFLLRGGKFKVLLDFTGIDPLVLGPLKITVATDGQVLDLERHRLNARAATWRKRLSGFEPAKDDDPNGFRVKWSRAAREGKGAAHA